MSEADDSTRTMRIDVRPDASRYHAGTQPPTWTVRAGRSTSVVLNRPDGRSGDYVKMLESIYDAVLITDRVGRILDFNSRAADFFLSDASALLGARVVDLISGADDSLLNAVHQNLSNHRYTLIEARCVRADRTMFPAEIAVNRVDLDESGELCFFVRDVTVRKRAQEALEDAVARLEAHDHARSQFVSNVSHELRTPLTSMIYAVSNMLRGVVGPLSDRARVYLEMLDGDCRRLLGTVNDILDLRKMEMHALELERARVPIARLVRRSVESLRVQARQKNQSLVVETGAGRWFVNCDPRKMERVVLNVAGNAVKFTPDEGEVRVRLCDDPDAPGHVCIVCRDTGIGIPAEALGRVTERYFTVGDQPSGSGLGLAISKEIVDLHGGRMQVESPAPGQASGTQVTVSLPVVEPPLVLVVDDDESVCHSLRVQAEGQGYRVIACGDGAQAFELVRTRKPDVVILDVSLPGMEGTELVLRMRSDPRMARVPVIVVSGVPLTVAKNEILHSFSIPTLTKPWKENELLDSLAAAFLGPGVVSQRLSAPERGG